MYTILKMLIQLYVSIHLFSDRSMPKFPGNLSRNIHLKLLKHVCNQTTPLATFALISSQIIARYGIEYCPILHHICPKFTLFSNDCRIKNICTQRHCTQGISLLSPYMNVLPSGVPKILQMVPTENFRHLSQNFAKLF